MHWLAKLFSISLRKKLVMALTGIFLMTFLIVHLAGNLQLIKNDGGKAFNQYAHFMGSNPLIQLVSKINLMLIFIHMVWAIILTKLNRNARGPVAYNTVSNESSQWSSRNMLILGMVILSFIIIHLRHFWVEMHYGNISNVAYDGTVIQNLYSIVVYWFSKLWYVSFYVFCMFGLAFHIWHGFPSAFQTLGINHNKYNCGISFIGKSMAIIIPSVFAFIPIMMYLRIISQ
ncbi:MAG: succinate dehydrogenase cytochrome b subunit [Proteobacteria bacterium]|nr:succinate dehydrogenase cytochrome b subunit [Pseudomonadota bacterium]